MSSNNECVEVENPTDDALPACAPNEGADADLSRCDVLEAVTKIRHALLNQGRFIEQRKEAPPAPAAAGAQLYLALCTDTAYATEPARWFVEALAIWLELDQPACETMEMALSEAVANAIVHGNLGLDSELRRSLSDFSHYCDSVGGRLADEGLSARYVSMAASWSETSVTVTVGDQGGGYDPAGAEARRSELAPFGRGLVIVRSVAEAEILDGGRSLRMIFNRRS